MKSSSTRHRGAEKRHQVVKGERRRTGTIPTGMGACSGAHPKPSIHQSQRAAQGLKNNEVTQEQGATDGTGARPKATTPHKAKASQQDHDSTGGGRKDRRGRQGWVPVLTPMGPWTSRQTPRLPEDLSYNDLRARAATRALFSVVYFSREASPKKVGARALLGDLVHQPKLERNRVSLTHHVQPPPSHF